MDRHVLMPLLEPLVLAHVVEVVSSDHNRPVHLHLLHYTAQNAAANGNIAGERTLLIDVCAFDCLFRT